MVKIALTNPRLSKVIKHRAIRGSVVAAKKGRNKTINELLPTVAMKTGDLRNAIVKSLTRSIRISKNTIQIPSLVKSKITSPAHAKHHIKPSRYGDSYDHPTIAGTKPVDPGTWNRTLVSNITDAIPDAYSKLGLQVRK